MERKNKLNLKYEAPQWLLDILYWTGIIDRPRQPKNPESKVIQDLRASGFKFGKSEDGHLLKPEDRNLI